MKTAGLTHQMIPHCSVEVLLKHLSTQYLKHNPFLNRKNRETHMWLTLSARQWKWESFGFLMLHKKQDAFFYFGDSWIRNLGTTSLGSLQGWNQGVGQCRTSIRNLLWKSLFQKLLVELIINYGGSRAEVPGFLLAMGWSLHSVSRGCQQVLARQLVKHGLLSL